ncbi:MAG: alpha/beta hydrolase family protein, partial [Halobacteriaceae archaeon]
ETGATATVVDADYGDLSPGVFTEAEYVTYDSEDGLEIGALLYRAPTTPSTAVVHVHGGPAARAERRFEPYGKYAQFFVSRGYTVLQPNYRGSTGRGAEFRRRIHGDWGGGDAADVAAAGEWLQSQAFVDADRVAVFGQSYGAYSVFVQLTKYPTLWTAGVAWNGRTEGGDRQYGPIDNAETVECPLLVLAGENDPRLDEMRRFRDALLERGWTEGEEFEYVELESEGHHSRDTDHQIRRFQHIEAFLDSRV